MTEKQKMLMGILYNAENQALIEERNHAKSLTRQFNEHWEDKGRRNYLIGQIFWKSWEECSSGSAYLSGLWI